MKPAVSDAWNIITDSLAAAGWVALVFGILVAVGAWLVGPGQRASAARTLVAPVMERAEVASGSFVVGMLVLIGILPIQMFRTTAILVVAGAIGFFVLRRQVEFESEAPAVVAPPAPVDVDSEPQYAWGVSPALSEDTPESRPSAGSRKPTLLRTSETLCGGALTVPAVAVEDNLVCVEADGKTPRSLLERAFEVGIGERLDLAAIVTDEMMMVMLAV